MQDLMCLLWVVFLKFDQSPYIKSTFNSESWHMTELVLKALSITNALHLVVVEDGRLLEKYSSGETVNTVNNTVGKNTSKEATRRNDTFESEGNSNSETRSHGHKNNEIYRGKETKRIQQPKIPSISETECDINWNY